MGRPLVTVGAAALAVTAACAPAQVIDRGPTTAPEVTLTFDTAYVTRYTAAVLEVLDDFNVDATMSSRANGLTPTPT
jgi:peptidoglycan/xylan/chitin deacetylase (PgdA/CDA1 family)